MLAAHGARVVGVEAFALFPAGGVRVGGVGPKDGDVEDGRGWIGHWGGEGGGGQGREDGEELHGDLVKGGGCVLDRGCGRRCGSRAGILEIMYRFGIDLGFLTGLGSPCRLA